MTMAMVLVLATVLTTAVSLPEKRHVYPDRFYYIEPEVEHFIDHLTPRVFRRSSLQKPDKRFISIDDIEDGLHHIGQAIEHGVQYLGHELAHIAGLDDDAVKELACRLSSTVGEEGCEETCNDLVWDVITPLCPAACHMVIHEADKLLDC